LDTVTKPDGVTRVRSKRSSTPGHARNGKDPAIADPSDLREMLVRAEGERARATQLLVQAEEDLDTAHQRLVDADAARRHLLDNVAAGGDEARRRFATALHDDVLQQLTAVELQLERIRTDARRTRYAVPLDQLKATIKQVEESLRSLLFNVSPAAQDTHVRLADAIRDRLTALKARSGIEPDVDLQLPKRIPDGVRSVVYRNVAEAVNNVEKHANATRVTVKAWAVDGGIQVVVADDGSGHVVAESLYLPGHLGLVAMRERAQLAGGWCRFESEPGAGTTVTFWIPNSL
jgi:signal transduction histidine kinase